MFKDDFANNFQDYFNHFDILYNRFQSCIYIFIWFALRQTLFLRKTLQSNSFYIPTFKNPAPPLTFRLSTL